MLRYVLYGLAALLLLRSRSSAATPSSSTTTQVVFAPYNPPTTSTSSPAAAPRTVAVTGTTIPTVSETNMTIALKAAQLATSATSASAAVYTAATVGSAGWGASLGLLGVPLAIKGIFDLAGLTDWYENGKTAIDYFRNRASAYEGAANNALNRRIPLPKMNLTPGTPDYAAVVKAIGAPNRNDPEAWDRKAVATIFNSKAAPFRELVNAYDTGGGYSAITANAKLYKRAKDLWGTYVQAGTGY